MITVELNEKAKKALTKAQKDDKVKIEYKDGKVILNDSLAIWLIEHSK